MSDAHINYVPRPDATPEAEREALAQVYRFVLDCQAKRETAEAASEPGKEMPAVPVLGQAGPGAHGRGR